MYKQRSRQVEALMYDGDNLAAVVSLIGQANVLVSRTGRVQVRSSPIDLWLEIVPDTWISRDPDDGYVTLHSGTAFERFWQPDD